MHICIEISAEEQAELGDRYARGVIRAMRRACATAADALDLELSLTTSVERPHRCDQRKNATVLDMGFTEFIETLRKVIK